MVGLVVVSHSENLAKSVVELTALMAPAAPVAAAGGMADGGFGTCFEKIRDAIESVRSEDGVLVIMDLGSAVMTTEMVVEPVRGAEGGDGGLPAGGRGRGGHHRRGGRHEL